MGRVKKSKRSKSRKKSKSKKKPRSRKKKALIMVGIVLASIFIPLAIYIPSLIWAAQQLQFAPTAFRLTSITYIPLGVGIEVDIQLTNPTDVPFPPVSAEFVLFLEGVEIGEGTMSEVQLGVRSSDITTISQSLSGGGVFLTLVSTLIIGFKITVKIQITKVTVFGISVPLNFEVVEELDILKL